MQISFTQISHTLIDKIKEVCETSHMLECCAKSLVLLAILHNCRLYGNSSLVFTRPGLQIARGTLAEIRGLASELCGFLRKPCFNSLGFGLLTANTTSLEKEVCEIN